MDKIQALISFRHLLALILTFLAASCAVAPEPEYGPIPDLINFDQRVLSYVREDGPIMGESAHVNSAREFLSGHFSPWRREAPVHDSEEAFWGLRMVESGEFFGENKLPLGPEWVSEMRRKSDPESFPNAGRTALAAVNTSMRVLPTDKPAFYDFARAGEGFPFDMMQNSAVWAGTPLFISHISADGAWYLAECRYAFGWIPVRDTALIDRNSAEALSTGPYVTPVKDRIPLHDWKGNYLFDLRIGQVLPAVARDADGYTILVPVRDPDGIAGMVEAEVSAGHVDTWPLAPRRSMLAGLADEMIGQPYGWGGLYKNRDCSSTIMDLFAAIGVSLPRNSKVQAGAGEQIDLTGLEPDEKKRLVLERGEPFSTLLSRPGHIMLYIGEKRGEPMIFHTAWGIKTEISGREGRKIIGKTVVTSLSPGQGVKGLVRPEGVLLHKLSSITFIDSGSIGKTSRNDAMKD